MMERSRGEVDKRKRFVWEDVDIGNWQKGISPPTESLVLQWSGAQSVCRMRTEEETMLSFSAVPTDGDHLLAFFFLLSFTSSIILPCSFTLMSFF